jgi:putative membrane protein
LSENNNALNQNSVSPSDLFAMEQAKLANDRTLLAYIRTSLSFFVAAAALIEFFDKSLKLEITAYISFSLGAILFMIGLYTYYRARKSIKAIRLNK